MFQPFKAFSTDKDLQRYHLDGFLVGNGLPSLKHS